MTPHEQAEARHRAEARAERRALRIARVLYGLSDALPAGTWIYVSDAEHKVTAWDRCRKAGAVAGIPQHGWRRAHAYGEGLWCWYTMHPAAIDRITAMLERRRSRTAPHARA